MKRWVVRDVLNAGVVVAVFALWAIWRCGRWLKEGPQYMVSVPFLGDAPGTVLMWAGAIVASLLALLLVYDIAVPPRLIGARAGWTQFIFHRPVPRRRIVAVRMLVASLAAMAAYGFAVLWHGLALARPGAWPAPFEWGFTLPAWQAGLALPLVVVGVFLAALWPRRLEGLLGGIGMVVIYAAAASSCYWSEPYKGWLTVAGVDLLALLMAAEVRRSVDARDHI